MKKKGVGYTESYYMQSERLDYYKYIKTQHGELVSLEALI